MGPQDGVKHVLVYSALQPGNLTLVECNDGSFRILHDERPVPGCRWESHCLDSACEKFRELTLQLRARGD